VLWGKSQYQYVKNVAKMWLDIPGQDARSSSAAGGVIDEAQCAYEVMVHGLGERWLLMYAEFK